MILRDKSPEPKQLSRDAKLFGLPALSVVQGEFVTNLSTVGEFNVRSHSIYRVFL